WQKNFKLSSSADGVRGSHGCARRQTLSEKAGRRLLTKLEARMPNKCLAPVDSGTQDDSMITKKYVCILAGATLLAACTQETQYVSRTKATPTPTATPGPKGITPGRPTEGITPAPTPH